MKLHIGCAKKILPGWTNLDIQEGEGVDIQDDACSLRKIADDSCEIIYACHILEHISRLKTQEVLRLWNRKLKTGGVLRISVPSFERVVEQYNRGTSIERLIGLVLGGQRDSFDYHAMIFDRVSLSKMLKNAYFSEVEEWNWRETDHSHIDDYSQAYLPHMDKENGMLMSLNLEAIK